jgi:hypothetical protein
MCEVSHQIFHYVTTPALLKALSFPPISPGKETEGKGKGREENYNKAGYVQIKRMEWEDCHIP